MSAAGLALLGMALSAEPDPRLRAAEARIEQLEAQLEASAAPEQVSFGQDLVVRGVLRGDAVAYGGNVRVLPGARVEGDAISYGGSIDVADDAVVVGRQKSFGAADEARSPLLERLQALARQIGMLLGFGATGVMIVALLPRRVARIAELLTSRPLLSTATGFMGLGFGLVISTLMGITLVLSPFSLVLMLGLAAMSLLGFVGMCQAIGDRLPPDGHRPRPWLAFLAGLAALGGLSFIPWLGKLTLLLLGMSALGAALVSLVQPAR